MVSRCNVIAGVTYSVSLVFAVIWLILAIVGFMIRGCNITLGEENPALILTLVYFYNENCVPSWWRLPDIIAGADLDLSMPKPSSRTTGVLWWYAVSCGLRVITALAALTAMVFSCKKSASPRPSPLAWTWVAVATAGLIGDLVCTILYTLDVGHTKTIEDLTGIDVSIAVVDDFLFALSLLPVLMLLFCSRFILIWLFELILLLMTLVSLKRQCDDAKLHESTHQRFEPWSSQLTNAAGVDKAPKGAGNALNGTDVVLRKPPSDGGSSANDPRSVSQYYAEPFSPGPNQQATGFQDTPDRGGAPGGAYMATPIHDADPYQLKPQSDVYAQPWVGGRPSRNPVPPTAAGGSNAPPRAWKPPSPEGRLGEWDPRSPMPGTEQPFFSPNGYGQPYNDQQQPQGPSSLTSFQPALPSKPPPATAAGKERGRRESREPKRYVQKLRDVEAEQVAHEAAMHAEARHMEDERRANERRQVEAALQEVTAKANAMGESRKKRFEADGTVRKRGPPPPPPARPRQRPEELQNQTPWSYVGPALSGPSALPLQKHNTPDEDYDDDDRPNVPVPDYTLHIKRNNDRPTFETN